MSARILAIGTATPDGRLGQRAAADMAARLARADAVRARTLGALYRRSGVGERGVVISDGAGGQAFYEPGECGPGTARRMALFAEHAPVLAARAAGEALERAIVSAESITHLVTVSCTGMAAPGVDLAVAESLGLRRDVERVNVGFMGCHGAINGMRVARGLAADDGARVLLCCVELCSAHFQYADGGGDGADVANALFGDGAAACVIAGEGAGRPEIRATASRVFEGSAEDMSWTIGDDGFRMTLSARVPRLIEENVGGWVDTWLGRSGLSRDDVGSWAVHPGGPRVLGAVRAALGLDEDATATAEAVLREHGNMSSATILFILERMLRAEAPRPIVALAFGPGLTGEAALIG
ncbi:MAG: type III polyketide synthase [Phycisphaerales bacterium]